MSTIRVNCLRKLLLITFTLFFSLNTISYETSAQDVYQNSKEYDQNLALSIDDQVIDTLLNSNEHDYSPLPKINYGFHTNYFQIQNHFFRIHNDQIVKEKLQVLTLYMKYKGDFSHVHLFQEKS